MNEYQQKDFEQKNKNMHKIFLGIVILELGLGILLFIPNLISFPNIELIDIKLLLLFITLFTGMCFILCRGLLRLKYINVLTEKDALTKSTDDSMDSYRQMKQERLVTMVIGVPLALIWALLVYAFFAFKIDLSFLAIDSSYIIMFVVALFFVSVFLLDGQFWKRYYEADLLFRIELFQLANVIVALYGIILLGFIWYMVSTVTPSLSLIILCLASACILGIPFYIKAIALFKNNQSTTPQ